jgi:hypothetical protein
MPREPSPTPAPSDALTPVETAIVRAMAAAIARTLRPAADHDEPESVSR